MNRLPKDRSELRARQQVRLGKLLPNTWPQSRPVLDVFSPKDKHSALNEAVDLLVRNVRLTEQIPEYGPQQLRIYRELRDLLYRTKKHQPSMRSSEVKGSFDASTTGTRVRAANHGSSIFRDPQQLTDELWDQYCQLNHNDRSTSPQNPFVFTDMTTNHKSAIMDDQHDEATTELASGYNTCLLRAQEAWGSDDLPENHSELDFMAVFGATISDWCASYTHWHPGVVRRWSLYSAMNDAELVSSLSRLAPRLDCHMKDAMLQGMSGGEVVETVIMPCTGMFSDSPSGQDYSGNKVWEASLLVCIVVWADYAGAADAKSSAGHRVWDLLAPWCSALAVARGVAADEIKATTMTLYGAKLGLFSPAPKFDSTHIWRSRGYDGAVHASAAAIAMTRGIKYHEDQRTLDLGGAAVAIHDSIDCEADVINRTECNIVLITIHQGVSVECLLDTIYATLVVNWTATDIYGQFPFAALQEQTGGSRWGGPAYSTEARAATGGPNFWTSSLSANRIASVMGANILPTTTELLSTACHGSSWHEMAMRTSAQELLAGPFGNETGEPARVEDMLGLSKGTFVLVCCTSCASCSQNPSLKLDDWAATHDTHYSFRISQAIQRVRDIVDGPLATLRAWLHSDRRHDAIYRITAEAFMAETAESRYIVMLLEGLIIEDALYHGTDTLSQCVAWLPAGLRSD